MERLEHLARFGYFPGMIEHLDHAAAHSDWLDALIESEAQLATGLTVPGEAIRQRIVDSIARLEAKPATVTPKHGATSRR